MKSGYQIQTGGSGANHQTIDEIPIGNDTYSADYNVDLRRSVEDHGTFYNDPNVEILNVYKYNPQTDQNDTVPWEYLKTNPELLKQIEAAVHKEVDDDIDNDRYPFYDEEDNRDWDGYYENTEVINKKNINENVFSVGFDFLTFFVPILTTMVAGTLISMGLVKGFSSLKNLIKNTIQGFAINVLQKDSELVKIIKDLNQIKTGGQENNTRRAGLMQMALNRVYELFQTNVGLQYLEKLGISNEQKRNFLMRLKSKENIQKGINDIQKSNSTLDNTPQA